MINEIRKQIAKEISEILNVNEKEIINLVQKSNVETADLESRVAFRYSKVLGKSPIQIADEIKSKLKSEKWEIENVKGYLNFKFKDEFYVSLLKEKYKFENKKEKVIIEFPSVNPNKPLHVGHLRNAILGDSISKIMKTAGYDVVCMDYIDDLGLQVAQIAWYLQKMKRENKENKKYDYWLGEEYVNASKYIEENPNESKKEIENVMHLMERNEIPFVREMCKKCVKAQHETLQNIGVYHDVMVWESEVVGADLLNVTIDTLEKKGILIPGEDNYKGCKIVKLNEHKNFKNLLNADKVFVRENGVATYTAKDIAFQMWKFGLIKNKIKFELFEKQKNDKELYSSYFEGKEMDWNNANKVINVIGMEQKYPQQVIKTTLELAGYKESENYIHLSYGHAKLAESSFSGRKGTWKGYSADKILEESKKRAYKLIDERLDEYSEKEKKEISEKVGLGALRYSFIKINPEKDIIFEWDKALNFEGDSGPYLQYSYARALHIIQKVGNKKNENYLITSDYEKDLIKKIIDFEDVILVSAENVLPNKIAEYALELCSSFNSFYVNCNVANEKNEEIKNARIKMIEIFIEKLGVCLDIMGVPKINRM